MRLCPNCGKPDHKKHLCLPALPQPMAKDMAKAPSTYRYRNAERRRAYMRRYMRGYGCKWCRVPEGYFERGAVLQSPDHSG
jgi:hypothetical protein